MVEFLAWILCDHYEWVSWLRGRLSSVMTLGSELLLSATVERVKHAAAEGITDFISVGTKYAHKSQ